jgi:D-tyrosyl-tRNA(Tyr) deacylase
MIAVVQRVTEAAVRVGEQTIGSIGPGLLALVAVCADDTDVDVQWTAQKLTNLRIFRNGDKHFDFDVRQAGGSVLLVSNFTVAAATRHGRRPSFDAAADPAKGAALFDALVSAVGATDVTVATGEFAADMRVHIINDGPATFLIDSSQARPHRA